MLNSPAFLSLRCIHYVYRCLHHLHTAYIFCLKVVPVDSRGDVLLTVLHSPSSTIHSQGRGSLKSVEEDDDSVCLHISAEDLGSKVVLIEKKNITRETKTTKHTTPFYLFWLIVVLMPSHPPFLYGFLKTQWKISRVVETSASMHKDKSFSIAAALPMPCYGSLVDDLSNACMNTEERLPFSQNDASSQHIAQQLTLLQQVNTSSISVVHHVIPVLLLVLLTTRGSRVSTNGPD